VILGNSDVLIAPARRESENGTATRSTPRDRVARDERRECRRGGRWDAVTRAARGRAAVRVAANLPCQRARRMARRGANANVSSSHTGIGFGDYLDAATAETEGCDLATLNVRHYPMFPGYVPRSNREGTRP
jgi:predicted nucleic acid-binding protein